MSRRICRHCWPNDCGCYQWGGPGGPPPGLDVVQCKNPRQGPLAGALGGGNRDYHVDFPLFVYQTCESNTLLEREG